MECVIRIDARAYAFAAGVGFADGADYFDDFIGILVAGRPGVVLQLPFAAKPHCGHERGR